VGALNVPLLKLVKGLQRLRLLEARGSDAGQEGSTGLAHAHGPAQGPALPLEPGPQARQGARLGLGFGRGWGIPGQAPVEATQGAATVPEAARHGAPEGVPEKHLVVADKDSAREASDGPSQHALALPLRKVVQDALCEDERAAAEVNPSVIPQGDLGGLQVPQVQAHEAVASLAPQNPGRRPSLGLGLVSSPLSPLRQA